MSNKMSRKQRVMAVSNAIASSALEGITLSPAMQAGLKQYADGKVTTQQLLEDAKRLYGVG
jgi:hypothetical protein